jgi:hypothetical protein
MTNAWNLDDLLLIIDESCMKLLEIAWILHVWKISNFALLSYMNLLEIIDGSLVN